ncbi:MAG: hypothetical protein HGA65_01145 [Oscillochloris sp.]|nr:hypothetical protein [Oscillochloris sp.]
MMDDAYGYEERIDGSDEAAMTASGDYLCVQHEGQLRYVYRRVPEGAAMPSAAGQKFFAGVLYSLAWIEDEDS